MSDATRQVLFEALRDSSGNRDGEAGYRVLVDGVEVVPRTRDMDISATAFDPLWAALGVELSFDYE